MLADAWKYRTVPEWEEENRPQSEETEEAKRWDHLVPKRELNHIRKHILRVERARGLRDHENRLLPRRTASEGLPPKTFPLEKGGKTENVHKMPKAKTKEPRMARVKGQMKQHRDRLIRGRELAEQRNRQRGAEKLADPAPPLLKPRAKKAEGKDLERVTAYPIAQPGHEARIEVTVLMAKSKEEKEVKKPLGRQFLSIPPFLKHRLENNKAEIF
ncbi:RNA polymerase I subunit H-like [Molossus nigricans]